VPSTPCWYLFLFIIVSEIHFIAALMLAFCFGPYFLFLWFIFPLH
jgi:hypothetical protein